MRADLPKTWGPPGSDKSTQHRLCKNIIVKEVRSAKLHEIYRNLVKPRVLAKKVPIPHDQRKAVIEEFELRGLRDKVYIMVGGYYMNAEMARRIGADCYTDDAGTCADTACRYLTRKSRRKKRNSGEEPE